MSPVESQLGTITRRLDGIRSSIRSLFVLDGASRLLVAVAAFVMATFAFDWLFNLPDWFRLVLLMGGLGAIGWIAARRIVYPLSVEISDDDLALFVERQYPELKDRLISAIQLSRSADVSTQDRVAGFNSPELVQALIGDAMQVTGNLDFNRVLIRQHVLKITAWAAVLFLFIGGGVLARPDLAKIYAKRIVGGKTKWPQRTQLEVLDFDPVTRKKTFARGDDITIAVKAVKGDPAKVKFIYTFKTGEMGEEQMARVQGRPFTQQFPHLSGPFTFRVAGGDDETEMYEVLTENPPSLLETQAYFEYPEYLEKASTPADRPEQAGNLTVPVFTKVRIVCLANEDLAECQLLVGPKGKEKTSAMTIEKDAAGLPRRVTATFTVEDMYAEYQINLKATNTLTNRDPIRYSIKGVPDLKPVIQVFEPAGDETITEVCKRPIQVITSDDNGVAKVSMQVRVTGSKTTEWKAIDFGPDQNRPRDYGRQGAKVKSDFILEVQPLGAKEGDFVEIRFVARDYRTMPEANECMSRVYRFAVVSMNALESELQQAIEKIKQSLMQQQGKEKLAYDKAGKIEAKFSQVDKLAPEQQGEIRGLAFEQQGIGEKLDTNRKEIDRVRLRGLWNGVFDEKAADALKAAVQELESVAGNPADPNQAVASKMASTLLVSASRAGSRERLAMFGQVQAAQGLVLEGIARALRMLDSWANYQEVISLVRRTMELMNAAKNSILK